MAKTSVKQTKTKTDYKYKKISITLTTPEEIALADIFESTLDENETSFHQEVKGILLNKFKETQKREITRDLKDDLFYAFRKASWSSLSPFWNNIKSEFRKENIAISLLDMKINLLLNLLVAKKDKDILSNPQTSDFAEPAFIEELRVKLLDKEKEWTKRTINKINQGDKAFQGFVNQFLDNEVEEAFNKQSEKVEEDDIKELAKKLFDDEEFNKDF